MTAFLLRRLGFSVVVLFVLLSFVFFAGRVIGNPVLMVLPAEASAEAVADLTRRLGLDEPLHVQFFDFIGGVVAGDFGESFWRRQPALPTALSAVPASLYLAGTAVAIAFPVAFTLGSFAARRPNGILDRLINVFSLGGVSTVDFWLGLMLILIFAVELGWFPTGGYGGPTHVILPALTLSYRTIGRVAQFTRSAMLEEYGKPYIKMARAKGMSERRIFGHAAKNAAIPVVTLSGDELANLANGAVVVETVFAWPGIGALIIAAITQRDLPLLEATVAVMAVIIIVGNLLVDATYSYLNPKIRR